MIQGSVRLGFLFPGGWETTVLLPVSATQLQCAAYGEELLLLFQHAGEREDLKPHDFKLLDSRMADLEEKEINAAWKCDVEDFTLYALKT